MRKVSAFPMPTRIPETAILSKPVEFFLEVPIYKRFSFYQYEYKKIISIEHFRGILDCYCMDCKKESVFYPEHKVDGTNHNLLFSEKNREYFISNHIFTISFFCVRNSNHKLYYIFKKRYEYYENWSESING
jgi:hypothetical protein